MKIKYLLGTAIAVLGLAVWAAPVWAMPCARETIKKIEKKLDKNAPMSNKKEFAEFILATGMENYCKHASNDELTETESQIQMILEHTFPSALNKTTSSNLEEIAQELQTIAHNLTVLLVNNQSIYITDPEDHLSPIHTNDFIHPAIMWGVLFSWYQHIELTPEAESFTFDIMNELLGDEINPLRNEFAK